MGPLLTPVIRRGGGVEKKYQASIETTPGDVNDRILFQGLGGSPRR